MRELIIPAALVLAASFVLVLGVLRDDDMNPTRVILALGLVGIIVLATYMGSRTLWLA